MAKPRIEITPKEEELGGPFVRPGEITPGVNLFTPRFNEGVSSGAVSGAAGLGKMAVDFPDSLSLLPHILSNAINPSSEQEPSLLEQLPDPLKNFKDFLGSVQNSEDYHKKFFTKDDSFSSLLKDLVDKKTPEALQKFTDFTTHEVAKQTPLLVAMGAGQAAGINPLLIANAFGTSSAGQTYQENQDLPENKRAEMAAGSGAIDAVTGGVSAELMGGGAKALQEIPGLGPVIAKATQPVFSGLAKAVGSPMAAKVISHALTMSLGQGSDMAANAIAHMNLQEHYRGKMFDSQQKLDMAIEAFGINAIVGLVVGSPGMLAHELLQRQQTRNYPAPERLAEIQRTIQVLKNGLEGSQNPENQIHVVDADYIQLEIKADEMIKNGEWNDSEGQEAIPALGQHFLNHFKQKMSEQRGSIPIGGPEGKKSTQERIQELRDKSYRGEITPEESKELSDLKKSITLPLDPVEGTGEEKVRRLSGGVEEKALEKNLTDGFGDLPEYKSVNMKDQAEKAQALMGQDPEKAKRIAMGEEQAPQGIIPESVFIAVENKAVLDNDVDTLRDLALNSRLATEATTMGQRIRTLGERNAESAMGAMKEVISTREKTLKRQGEEKPSKEQEEEIASLKKKLEESEKAFDEYRKKQEAKKKPSHSEFGSKNRIFTKDVLAEAKASLKEKMAGLRSGIDPTAIKEITQIGGYYFEGGVRDFSEWSNTMISEFGENIKPFLQEAWKNIRETFDRVERERLIGKISGLAEAKKDLPLLSYHIQKLSENLIANGASDRETLVTQVHDILKEIIPGISRRETADAISGYGKYKPLSKDQIKAKLRDLKGQLQNVSKLEDIQGGKSPLKTGIERRTPSDEERRLIQLVEAAKKKYGIETTDPATQLKSALDAVKTRLRNQIEDLKSQIENKEKLVKEKYSVPDDAETKALRKKRDSLKEDFDKIFGTTQMTDAQRLKIAVSSAERSLSEYERRIKEKDFSAQQKTSKTPITPELEKLWKKRDAAKEEYQRLKDIAFPKKTPEQAALDALKNRLAKRASELQDRLDNLDFSKKTKRVIPLDPEAIILEAKKSQAQMAYEESSKLQATITHSEAAEITRLAKEVADKKILVTPKSEKMSAERMDYGRALADFRDYVAELKKNSEKLTWKDFKAHPVRSSARAAIDASGIFKALKSTGDFSMLLGQGFKSAINHPDLWLKNSAKSFVDMAKTFGKNNVEREIKADIMSRPLAMDGTYKKYKLDVFGSEEAYPSSWPEKLPVIGTVFKGFENSFTGFIQRMRADLFDHLYSVMEKSGADKTGLGIFVNSLLGRGNLPFGLEKVSGPINKVMFSAKYLMSDIDFLLAHTNTPDMSPALKKRAALNLLRTVTAVSAVLAISKAINPDSVEEDPRSADFGAIKIGPTRFKITRLTNVIVLAMRLLTNSTKSSTTGKVSELNTGKWGARTRGDVVADFFQNRLSPAASVINDLYIKGTDFKGDAPTAGGELSNLTVPFPISTAQELAKDPNQATVLVGIIANALGINTNTYEGKKR